MKKLLALGAAGLLLIGFYASFAFVTLAGVSQGQTSACSAGGGATGTGKLSAAQVAAYASEAGFAGPALITAVALTMPESGADSTNVQKGQPAATTGYGLWQITPGNAALLDPLTNAKAAYAKFISAGGFTPWTTFTGGQYLAWIAWATSGVTAFLANPTAPSSSCQATLTADGIAAVSKTTQEPLTPVEPGAPFPTTGFPFGQCTYWAALNVPVNWSGNAWEWWANAAAAGRAESSTPAAGDIVVYGPNYPGSGGYGHVAVVIGVQSATSFTVSEMNYLGVGLVDERQSDMAYVSGFIAA